MTEFSNLIEAPFDDFMIETGLLETYKDVLEDILLNYVGRSSSDLEASAFSAVDAETSGVLVRRFIGECVQRDDMCLVCFGRE